MGVGGRDGGDEDIQLWISATSSQTSDTLEKLTDIGNLEGQTVLLDRLYKLELGENRQQTLGRVK